MKKLVVGVVVVVAAFLGGGRLMELFASAEDRAFLVLEKMARGFDDGEASLAVAGLAATFRDDETGATKDELRDGFRYLLLQHRGRLPWRCRIPREEAVVRVDDDHATVDGRCRFDERRGDGWNEVWVLEFTARLERRGGDWTIVAVERSTTSGRRPF